VQNPSMSTSGPTGKRKGLGERRKNNTDSEHSEKTTDGEKKVEKGGPLGD